MTHLDIARRRLTTQRLIGAPFRKAEDVVQWLGAVQAQDYAGARWGIGQRVKDCVATDVDRAYAVGKILRTHILRPTWHFVAPEDIRWMLQLTAPRVQQMNSYQYASLALDEAVFRSSQEAFIKALQGANT